MYTVYVLKDDDGVLYKGMTNNLARRLQEHRSGHTLTTRKMGKLSVVYQEEYVTLREARSREVYFKSAAGRRYIKNVLASSPSGNRLTPA